MGSEVLDSPGKKSVWGLNEQEHFDVKCPQGKGRLHGEKVKCVTQSCEVLQEWRPHVPGF